MQHLGEITGVELFPSMTRSFLELVDNSLHFTHFTQTQGFSKFDEKLGHTENGNRYEKAVQKELLCRQQNEEDASNGVHVHDHQLIEEIEEHLWVVHEPFGRK